MATLSITKDGSDPPPSAPSLGPEASPGPLERFGDRYVLLRELAAGGMGRVYLARMIGAGGFSRTVALKRIRGDVANRGELVTMFLDEARIAARIQHPNVCPVLDFGQVDGAYFIAMEYLRGLPFSELLRELGRRPAEESPERLRLGAHLLAQACEGLHAAHELRDDAGAPLNVVHRDVSPHNLFVGFDGSLRVLDFGIARAADRLTATTTGGRVKGKYAYMAPEQARRQAVDRRADVFSLGVIAWELATLRRLYRRDTAGEMVMALIEHEPEPPMVHAGDVPEALSAVILKALARDPDARFATAREMGQALSRAVAAEGWAPTPGDVADWMDRLFPGRREASYRLAASAREPEQGPAAVDDAATEVDPSLETTRVAPGRGPRTALTVLAVLIGLSLGALAAAAAWYFVSPASDPAAPSVTLPASAD